MAGALTIGRRTEPTTAMQEDLKYSGHLASEEEKRENARHARAKGMFSTHMSEALRLNYMEKAPYSGYSRKHKPFAGGHRRVEAKKK
jgi:hypothetical protein